MKNITRAALSMLLLLTLITSMPVVAEETVEIEISSKKVSVDFAKKVGQYHLETFYANDQAKKGCNYVVDGSYIIVYDDYDSPYAYLLEVQNAVTNEEAGYVMIGASYDNPAVLEACLTEPLVGKLSSQKNTEQLTYIAPLVLAMKGEKQYTEVRTGVEIDPSLNQNNEKKTVFNEAAYSKSNAETWSVLEGILSNESIESVGTLSTSKAYVSPTVEEVYDEADFCKIKDGSTYRYGGRQQWWNGDPTYNPNNSCGVVAAANITAYWAKHKSSYADLYDYSDLNSSYHSKSNFQTHMEDVYSDLDPTIVGIYSTSLFRNRTRDFMDRKLGYHLSSGSVSASSYGTYVSDIKEALDDKAPIAMLYYTYDLSGSAPSPNFAMHWVTYTKYFKDNNTQNEYFACSSWGKRYSLGLYDYYNCYDISGGIYFK